MQETLEVVRCLRVRKKEGVAGIVGKGKLEATSKAACFAIVSAEKEMMTSSPPDVHSCPRQLSLLTCSHGKSALLSTMHTWRLLTWVSSDSAAMKGVTTPAAVSWQSLGSLASVVLSTR